MRKQLRFKTEHEANSAARSLVSADYYAGIFLEGHEYVVEFREAKRSKD